MRRAAVIVSTAVAAVFAVTLLGQAPPDFSGKWTLVADPNSPPPMGGGLGQEATIAQDATTLTITRTTQFGEFKTVYKLDGTESKNTLNMGGNTVDQMSKTKWAAGKLTINTSMSFAGNPVETVLSLWLDGSGNLLTESTRPDFQGGGAPITTKLTYKKN